MFAIAPATGRLTVVERVSTGGKTPRNFAIDPTGRTLLAANQGSDSVVVFRIDDKTGRLTPTGQVVEVGAAGVRDLPLRAYEALAEMARRMLAMATMARLGFLALSAGAALRRPSPRGAGRASVRPADRRADATPSSKDAVVLVEGERIQAVGPGLAVPPERHGDRPHRLRRACPA